MNFYSIDISDWIADTAGKLSMIEEGAYVRMVNQYFRLEEPLPLELSKLFRMIQAHTDQEREAVKSVLDEFFIETDEGFVSDKMDEKKEEIYAKSEKARKSSAARWAKKEVRKHSKKDSKNANASKNDTNACFFDAKEKEKEKEKTTTSQTPKSIRKKTVVTSEHFQKFWNLYPNSDRKGAKGKCVEVWRRKKLDQDTDLILAHLRNMEEQYTRQNCQYCPAPLVYLNGDKWDGYNPAQISLVDDQFAGMK